MFPVDEETLVGCVTNGTDADALGFAVEYSLSIHQLRMERVEVGGVWMPQGRFFHHYVLLHGRIRSFRKRERCLVLCHHTSKGILQLHEQHKVGIIGRGVSQVCGNVDSRTLLANLGEGYELTATGHAIFLQGVGDVDVFSDGHPHVTVDAAVIIEIHIGLRLPRRGKGVMLSRYSNSKQIISIQVEIGGNISSKAHVSTMVLRHSLAVHINFAIGHYTFKVDSDALALTTFRQLEVATIPSYSVINHVTSTMLRFELHDVRQSHRHPSGVDEIRFRTLLDIATIKRPVRVHL